MAAKEVWVRSNRRVLALAMVAPAALAAVGVGITAAADASLTRGLGIAMIAAGSLLVLLVVSQMLRPRVAYRDGHVLFYMRPGAPIAVPVAAVEAFFLGQGPARLPGEGEQPLKATNLVARISQKHPEWEHVAVKPALGRWCESYVTMNGPWCEPLNGDVIRKLNHRLRELHAAAGVPTAAPADPPGCDGGQGCDDAPAPPTE